MASATFTCPRCFLTAPLTAEVKFCPRCGLGGLQEAAQDQSPLDVRVGGRTIHVMDRLAIGSISSVYRCRFDAGRKPAEGIFKIARDACTNHLIANEAEVLRRLAASSAGARLSPFIPNVAESFDVGDSESTAKRRANVLQMHEAIASTDELYSLDEVKGHFSTGLDPRHMAWIWRRVLTVLDLIHHQDVIHTAVLPAHVLIEPREHKLLLVDWCCAVSDAGHRTQPATILSGGHLSWYKREDAVRNPPTSSLDIGLGARTMIWLIGGDPERGELPANAEPALARYFERCIGGPSAVPKDAGKLLDDFDRVIEALWGPRRFHALKLPQKHTRDQ